MTTSPASAANTISALAIASLPIGREGHNPATTFAHSALHATTDAGAAMVDAAERYAEQFAAGALDHYRDGTFANEHLESLRQGRFLVAPIPVAFGGGGVDSTHDVLVAVSRLARGDAATAIGVSMHLATSLTIVRQWQIATTVRQPAKVNALGGVLGGIAVSDGFTTGMYSVPTLDRDPASGAFHAAASVGIAEAAHARIVATLARRAEQVAADTHAAMRLSQYVIDLVTMRVVFDRAAAMIDQYHAEFPAGDAPLAAAQAVFTEVQAAQAHVNDAATRITERALALSGGAGYITGHPLSKAWRDARPGAFRHLLGADRAHDFLARTALGLEPRS